MNHVKLTNDVISVEEVTSLVTSPSCGAISVFIGSTRDNFDNKPVVKLEYEAYESMGIKALEQICGNIREKWSAVENIAIYHRLGIVPVKEASIVIAISSPHREEAIKATEWCINNVKKSAPIWKKEVYANSESEWKENKESAPYPPKRKRIKIEFEQKIEVPYVPPYLIQVNASKTEVDERIKKFMERKRADIDTNNVREFCCGDRNSEFTCARVDAVLQKRKDSKSHLQVNRVLNSYQHRDQTNSDYLRKFIPPNGIEERLQNLECQLSLTTVVPKNIYSRLKSLEDRLMYLESVSPEYMQFWFYATINFFNIIDGSHRAYNILMCFVTNHHPVSPHPRRCYSNANLIDHSDKSLEMEVFEKPQIICHNQQSLDYAVHDVKWIPCSAKFIALGGKSNGAGIVEIYCLTGEGVEKRSEFCKKEHFKCGTFDASSLRNRHLATGDFAGRLQVWDLEDNLVPVYMSTAHKAVINSIDGVSGTNSGCGAPEIVTGSRDGSVMVWDVRQKDTPVAKFLPTDGTTARDCWCVAFGNSYNNEERVVAAGYDNGDVKMYDLKTMSVRWSKCVKNGVVGLQFDRKNILMNKLVVTTLESKLYCFDVRTQHPKKGFAYLAEKAHNSTIWTVKHLPQNREIFMTTGGSGTLCLWKYNYPSKRVDKDSDSLPYGVVGELSLLQNCTLSDQPITSFDWCVDKIGLAVCSAFDQTVRVLITTKLNLY